MKPHVRAWRAGDLDQLAENLRPADKKEVWLQAGVDPRTAIELSVAASTMVRVGVEENGLACVVFGLSPLNILTREGLPWLLATDDIERNFVTFARFSIKWRDKMLRDFEVLTNFVHDEHGAAKRWLIWLGFELSEPRAHGPFGAQFRKATLEKKNVHRARSRRLRNDRLGTGGSRVDH